MERTLRLLIAYEGTDFHGWQRQVGVRTVQQEIEQVLRRVLRHPLTVRGASRTDAGVHARGQVATVTTTSTIPAGNLHRAVGDRLPRDIALLDVREVPFAFHPSLSAISKLYRYRIHAQVERPVARLNERFVWHVWYPLDADRLRAAAARFIGTHDFASFASQGSPRENTVRNIHRFEVRRCACEIHLDVEGDGFLYNQVRNMVGTLIEIGRGRWAPEHVDHIIAARDRREAATTAPPQGLCLQWINYGPMQEPAR